MLQMHEKLDAIAARREQIRQELDDLREARPLSNNIALPELESALMAELNAIETRISQIQTYLRHVEDNDE